MGQHNSKSVIQLYAPNFEIHSRDETHGLYYLLEKGSHRQFIFKRIPSADLRMTEMINKHLEKKKSLVHDNLVALRDYFIEHHDPALMMTASGGALYEFPFDSLEDYRKARSRAAKKVTEREMWEIIIGCSRGFGYLQSKSIQHSGVRANSIYIETTGRIKIADPEVKGLESNYDLFVRQVQGIYLSPNEIQSLREGQKMPAHNCFKSDVFVMGIVMLELATLQTQDDLYDHKKLFFKEDLLKQRKATFLDSFGRDLGEILQMMTERCESDRMDWIELERELTSRRNKSNRFSETNPPEQRETKTTKPSPKKGKVSKQQLNINHLLKKAGIVKTDPLISIASQSRKIELQGFLGNFSNTIVSINETPREQPFSAITKAKTGTSKKEEQPQAETDRQIKETISKKTNHRRIVSNVETHQVLQKKDSLPRRSPDTRAMKKAYLQDELQRNIQAEEEHPRAFAKRSDMNLLPMAPSQPDRSSDLTLLPKCKYQLRTTTDENLVEITYRESIASLVFTPREETNEGQPRGYRRTANNDLPAVEQSRESEDQQMQDDKLSESARKGAFECMKFVRQAYAQGTSYEGWKLRGMRHGTGKFCYEDGGRYEGQWRKNRMHGRGILYYPSGEKAYDGYWQEDHFHGRGKLLNESSRSVEKYNYSDFNDVENHWHTYEGDFQQDLKSGFGILVLSNGQTYEGCFRDNMVHGEGIFRGRSGTIKGRWQQNKLVKIL